MANNREISQFAGLVTVNDSTNAVTIGSTLNVGTLPASPNITLNADGSSSFAGRMDVVNASPGTALDIKEGAAFVGSFGTDGTDFKIGAIGNSTGRTVFTTKTLSTTYDRVMLDNGGNLLIGGTLPSSPNITLAANGVISTVSTLTATDQITIAPPSGANETSTLRMIGRDSGGISFPEVFFNVTTESGGPASKLTIRTKNNAGNRGDCLTLLGNARQIQFNAYGAGTLSTNSSGVISASDGRFKTKTREVENGLAAVLALQPTYYRWNEDSPFSSEYEEIGFVAQEVAEVIPEASPGEDQEDVFRNYHDRAIIAMLVKAVKELKAELDLIKK